MKEEEVIKILLKSSYKKQSVKSLCHLMDFFEKKFKTKKGNWSLKLYDTFLKENFKKQSINLDLFYQQYSNRKKQNKKFQKFMFLIIESNHKKSRIYFNLYNRISLLDKGRTKEFLRDMKVIKNRYLNCSDATFVESIFEHFETGYSDSTVRNYYYHKKK